MGATGVGLGIGIGIGRGTLVKMLWMCVEIGAAMGRKAAIG